MNKELKKMDITIVDCVPCDHGEYALSVTRELLKNRQHEINQLTLITGSKGIFDVKVNGELPFSKKELDHYPEAGEISKLLMEKISDNALSIGGEHPNDENKNHLIISEKFNFNFSAQANYCHFDI